MFGLQSMVKVCEHFGREYCVSFNVTKSYAISYASKALPEHIIIMNGNPVQWLDRVSHLSNSIQSDLNDRSDVCAIKDR